MVDGPGIENVLAVELAVGCQRSEESRQAPGGSVAGRGWEFGGSVFAGVLGAGAARDLWWIAATQRLQGIEWGSTEVRRLLDWEHVCRAGIMLGPGAEVEIEADRLAEVGLQVLSD